MGLTTSAATQLVEYCLPVAGVMVRCLAAPKTFWANTMRSRIVAVIMLALLAGPMMARAQDDNNWPPSSYLRSDYRRVTAVAHVRIRDAAVVKTIGGYEDWHLVADVVEPFKGAFRKGQMIEFYHGAEKGFKKELFLGDKIVFLERNFIKEERRWVYAVLENSTLPYTEDRARKLRRIRAATKPHKTKPAKK